jgi:hypothetical protein|tara:strand:+ start:322 stop:501 length:180 start_codon:yes stop_codon:yes gene_type:complete
MKPITCMKIAFKGIKSRRHYRLVRGSFQKAISHLSSDLQDSALREFDRVAKKFGSSDKY